MLHIKNLEVAFDTDDGSVSAVKNVSLEVKRGEIVAIVGESGSGKSVTALSILGLPGNRARLSGEIWFSPAEKPPQNLLALSPQEMRKLRGNRIALVFQEPMTSLNPVFTCGRQVVEAIRLHRPISAEAAKMQTIRLFEQVKLPDPPSNFTRYPHQLSGGQKQRVMIAMAMSCNPSLLIADEPTTALDVTVQKSIILLIRELQQQFNMGVIFITHDLGLVSEIATRVAVMYKGSIVEEAPVDKIFRAPAHPYTRSLLACRPVLHPKGERLPVVSDFMTLDENGRIIEKEGWTPVPVSQHYGSAPAVSAEVLLKVSHLQVRFKNKTTLLGSPLSFTNAVDDVSFEAYKGETLGLVGESGCGKTTLGRSLLRLIEPSEGSILFRGTELTRCSRETLRNLRRDMQIIFQDPFSALNPRMTIGNAIIEPLMVHRIFKKRSAAKENVIALLEKVDLKAGHYNRYPHELSGGQRQRVVIARALILHPSFIICDESVSSLDVSVQAQVLNLLNDLKKEFGFTAIFISHDLSVVRYISDRIMVMYKGRLVESGTAEQIYRHPQTDYTRNLIKSIPGISSSPV